MAGNFGMKPMQKYFAVFKPSITSTILPRFVKISKANYQRSRFTEPNPLRMFGPFYMAGLAKLHSRQFGSADLIPTAEFGKKMGQTSATIDYEGFYCVTERETASDNETASDSERITECMAMNNKNKTLNGGRIGRSSVAPSLETTELVKKNNLVTSNRNDNSGHSLAEPSIKRTKSTNRYGDAKQGHGSATGSECNSLTTIEKLPNGSQQSFEPHKQQQSLTSLPDAGLVSLHNESNGYTSNHFYDGAATNGTLDEATNGFTTNGYAANGNGVTLSSPLPDTSQNPEMGHEQTINEVSATKATGLIQSAQNSDPIRSPKEIPRNIRQLERQSATSHSTSCNKSGQYSYGQSSLCNDTQNGHNVKVVDFRSDTCSLPTDGMRDAIYRAEVGDAVYGEDPSVIALEKKSAKLFQKEAACFLPSGTMSNLVAILVHCNRRGSEIIAGSKSHILLLEQTGASQFGGVNMREIENNPDGTFSLDKLKTKIWEEDVHTPYTSLICVENTHNVLGGKVLPQQWVDELCSYAKSVNLPVHMDGARIFSASTKLNIPVSEITRNVDTVTYCISKNLGAPYGAVLLGTSEFINKARRVIKALGGGVRQIGFMAAAGLYALDNMVERLSIDHNHVQMIANAIRELNHPHVKVLAPEDIHTNILVIRLNSSKITATEFVNMLSTIYDDEERPVMIKSFAMDSENVRFVLCSNNSKSDVEDAIQKVCFVINKIR